MSDAFLELLPGAKAKVVYYISPGNLFFIQNIFNLKITELIAFQSYFFIYVGFAMYRFGLQEHVRLL